MKDKIVVVTGAGSGVGLETADALAREGASLAIVELDRARGEAAVRRIAQHGIPPKLFLADLSEQADVRRVAKEIIESLPRIHVLINNAGAWFKSRQVTADGLERTFALNHMGYFLLTNLLLDRLRASAPARIVSVSSDGHAEATLDFSDLQLEANYSGRVAYCRSKLANILFTRSLSRRLQGTRVTANCLHPGHVNTNFFDSFMPSKVERDAKLQSSGYVPPALGARTAVFLASSPSVATINGQYFDNCEVAQPSAAAQDDASAERLWEISAQLARLETQDV